MKRREKLKICKLNLHNTIADIRKFTIIDGKYYAIVVSMDAIITNPDYASSICEGISNALSFDNAEVVVSFDLNTIIVEYPNCTISKFASLDVDSVLEGDDNILYFKNIINVFIKD